MRQVTLSLRNTKQGSLLDCQGLADLLGVRCGRSLRRELERGNVPPPDKSIHQIGRYPKLLWSYDYLKQFEGQQFTVATRNKTR
jgi:hypothetical protein